jgi:hypothetical protein
MNLGMFNRCCPSLKNRAHVEEIIELNKFDRNREKYVIPKHRKNFGLINGCRNLERIFVDCRYNNVILVHSTRNTEDRLRERED